MGDTDSTSNVKECSKSSEDLNDLSEQSESLSDDSSEVDQDNGEWEVAQLSEDEEDTEKRILERDSKELVCLRCPTRAKGTFQDKREYFFHIKRHMFGNHYSCPTCHRPFINMSYCISHEIRVHGTNIPYKQKHPVVVYAKEYVNAKAQSKSVNENETEDQVNQNPEHEIDSEDVSFYENHIICSNALMRYQGPPVDHMVECYEIQLFHSRRSKASRANIVARKAIWKHKKNVAAGLDVNRFGRYLKKRVQPRFKPNSPPPEPASENKLPQNPAQDGSLPGPSKQKRKIIRYITSSSESESDDETDKDYNPPPRKKINLKNKKKREEPHLTKGLPALMETICRKCNYVWENDTDLRKHRDAMHPTLPLFDLMAINARVPKFPFARRVKPKSKPEVAKKRSGISVAPEEFDGTDMFTCLGKFPKKKVQGLSPESDSTVTDKQKYLHSDSLGLSNEVRLQLLKNRSSQLKLPECYVPLERLTDP